ncbi:RyR domain-containing protein [Actinoplanes sp. URMC 104]|uniref:RyR domain-containing protein n=1 Tax=Actinoplanes sp. URMC 104 TaxID=3423409 RepID=UPI003F1A12E1
MTSEQSDGPGRVSWIARGFFTLVAVGAFGCGLLGFRQYLPGHDEYGRGFLDLVYYSLQLFVLDAAPLQNAKNLPVLLQVARFAAPAVTAYLILLAVQALIAGRLRQGRIAVTAGHSIVCGPPELTARLVRQILGEARGKVIVVGPGGPVPRGALQVTGDPRRPAVLARARLSRAREVIAVGPDSVRNAEVAIAVHTVDRGVTCYAEAEDRDLFEAVIRQRLGSGESRVDLFARHDRTARGLLDCLPPFPPADPRSAVLVIGYAGLGRVLVERLLLFWAGETGAGRVTPSLCVLDPAVPADAVRVRHADPRGRIAVTARTADPGWLTSADDLTVPGSDGAPRIPGRVYVCLDDDAAGIATGNAVLRLLAGHDTTVVVAVSRSGVLGEAALREAEHRGALRPVLTLGRAQLVLVSVPRTAYAISAIRTGTNEALARAVHEAYVRNEEALGETVATNPSVVAWADLPPHLRESNREQAWHIGHKLRMIGYAAVPATGAVTPVTLADADVEMLAKVEHLRWTTERRAKGWTHGELRDDDRKQHPDLVDWDRLPPRRQEKDRAAVRAIPSCLAAAGLTLVPAPRRR